MGVPNTPIAGWFIVENPIYKMDDDWGYPHFRKPPDVSQTWIKMVNLTGIPWLESDWNTMESDSFSDMSFPIWMEYCIKLKGRLFSDPYRPTPSFIFVADSGLNHWSPGIWRSIGNKHPACWEKTRPKSSHSKRKMQNRIYRIGSRFAFLCLGGSAFQKKGFNLDQPFLQKVA